jgi:hypothetical protein
MRHIKYFLMYSRLKKINKQKIFIKKKIFNNIIFS